MPRKLTARQEVRVMRAFQRRHTIPEIKAMSRQEYLDALQAIRVEYFGPDVF